MSASEIKKKKKFRSLATTLAITFLLLLLAVVLVSNGLQLYFNFQAQQATIASQQYMIAQNAADSVKSFIQERFSMLEAVAGIGLSSNRPEEEKNVIDKLLGREPSFRQ